MSARIRSLQDFLSLLKGVRENGKGRYMAQCPAHNDRTPSLSVTELRDKLLVHCMAGCSINAVLSALKLEASDLFLNSHKPQSTSWREPKEIETTYDYHDEQGKVLFQLVRFNPKSFAQRRPEGTNGWAWGLREVTPVIYHLPAVAKAKSKGDTVFLCEGEKDADNLATLGVVTTTNPMGAGKWRDSYTRMLKGSKLVVVVADNDAPGRRHARNIARSLYEVGTPVKLLEMPADNIKDVSDWLERGVTADLLKESVDNLPLYTPPLVPVGGDGAPERFRRTDLGNAERLVSQHGENIHYCYQRKSWIIWTGREWKWDTGAKIMTLAQRTVRTIYSEAANEDDDDERKRLADHAKASESNTRIKAMIEQAEPMCAIDIKDMDNRPWLLNCKNGTIDLKTGELRLHNKDDYLTMTAPVDYDPSAQSDLWDAFLNRIFSGNTDLISYLQCCMGYTLCGETTEQCLFFCWGTGMNGKSTFLNAFRELLGPFSLQADAEMFMLAFKAYKQGHSEDVANLAGKRLVVGSEIEEGRRLAVTKIKQMTGGETVRASHKYEKEFEFDVTYKIWLNGNHKPEISDTTYSIWRRVKLIPFGVKIPIEEQDKQLKYKLRTVFPALLNWAVQGCLDWQQYGLGEPAEVTEATEVYRREQDTLGDFIDDRCSFDSAATIGKGDLFRAYQEWASNNGINPVGQKTFNRRLNERGLTDRKGTHGKRTWCGIRLLITEEVAQVAESSINSPYKGYREKDSDFPATSATGDSDDLSPNELRNMLEDYEGMTVSEVIGLWEKSGQPEIRLDDGSVLKDLGKYLAEGIMNMDHLGAIAEWVSMAKNELRGKEKKGF